jgi:NTP pyrophosphatase (non-canonical NTP hydrolase)
MDGTMTFEKLRIFNVMRCEDVFHKLDEWHPNDWMTALCGEVGEAANLLKKAKRGEEISISDIAKELADVIIYTDLLAARLRIDLNEAVISKFNEVSDRRGSNIKL